MSLIRVCDTCRAAENPRGQLAFHDTAEGALCDRCFKARTAPVGASPSPLMASTQEMAALVVVKCPPCGGRGFDDFTRLKCSSCVGYGSVRVPANALPVYRPAAGSSA